MPAAERFRAPDNGSFVYELVAIPEHGYALAGRSDGSLTLWKLPALGQNTKVPTSPASPHRASIAAFARDTSGERLVSIDGSGLVAVWDAATLATPRTFMVPRDHELVLDADLSADGKLLMVATQAGMQFWDLDRQAQLSSIVVSDAQVAYAAMSADGTHVGATIQAADGNVSIQIWNLTDGATIRHSLDGPDTFVDVSFTNDSEYFATLDIFGGLAAYRVADAKDVAILAPEDVTTTLTGGPLGGLIPIQDHSLIAANGSANALVWNAATSQVLGTYPLAIGGSPTAITSSGNGFVASDVAGTMTWVPFARASSASLAVPAGAVAAGSRFGISAARNLLLAGAGHEYAVWDTRAERAASSFTASRADQAVATSSRARRYGASSCARICGRHAQGARRRHWRSHGREAVSRHRQRTGFVRGRLGRRQHLPNCRSGGADRRLLERISSRPVARAGAPSYHCIRNVG